MKHYLLSSEKQVIHAFYPEKQFMLKKSLKKHVLCKRIPAISRSCAPGDARFNFFLLSKKITGRRIKADKDNIFSRTADYRFVFNC